MNEIKNLTESQSQANVGQVPLIAPVFETSGLIERPDVSDEVLQHRAHELARELHPAGLQGKVTLALQTKLAKLEKRLEERLAACEKISRLSELTPQLELLESTRMLQNVLKEAESSEKQILQLLLVESPEGDKIPRVMRVTEEYLDTAHGIWSGESLSTFINAIQQEESLNLREIQMLPTFLKLAQLEFVLDRADETFASVIPPIEQSPFSGPLHSLRRLNQYEWPELLEPLVAFYSVLAQDPHTVFLCMDEETRTSYMERVAELAKRSNYNEVQVAQTAIELAQAAAGNSTSNTRLDRRRGHVGYFLFEEGVPELSHRIGYHPPFRERLHTWLMKYAEDVYIIGIIVLSITCVAALIRPLVPHHEFIWTIAALLLALLPSTQGASDIVNNAVTAFIKPRALPKLDYMKSIPDESSTFVVVPTLLLNEAQVFELFEEIEARWLSNTDPNLHFGLLTDLPDSATRPQTEDRNELVNLAVRLTDDLNAKYGNDGGGSFLLLHRHRVFNQKQGVWMGWERKRGKLLDLNKLLRGEFDSFPVKAGPTHLLSRIRYVITLDSDTQLPRKTAARMIATMAHPLNQAIIDPQLRIVTKGYGILQPRVGVSVASASRSRLATLYSGETGFDIYTRAVSDVYQDLFREGIFTGKGIYEASVLHEVLDRRFPRDTLLSHDLIEGAYARAGLVTDIEIIDDYPSHYSAYTRRKHRWVRGDWQITQWLLDRVPEESGKKVRNPISLLSQWKIVDNLRRSLVEPVTFILLICGWLILPGGARYWTFVVLTLMLLPVFVQLVFTFGRALLNASWEGCLDAFRAFWSSLGFQILNLAFLPHQTLLAIDAIVRSLVRSFLTGRSLLEWETAAQAEAKQSRSSLDLYLQASPVVALVIAGLSALRHHFDLFVTGPILILWACAPLITGWLNSPPRKLEGPLSADDQHFLERQALLTWRYYSDFGGEDNHWLIPDNVEEKNRHEVLTLTPTNLGMLFNARQAALALGFITLPEFTRATLGTLDTYSRLEKVNGHIYNWINIPTLQAVQPFTISTVDSGNLAASLYALHGGAMDSLKKPLIEPELFSAIRHMLDQKQAVRSTETIRQQVKWLFDLDPVAGKGEWMLEEAERRRLQVREYIEKYLPWLMPRFAPLFEISQFQHPENDVIPYVIGAVEHVRNLNQRLGELAHAATGGDEELALELRTLLSAAEENVANLATQLSQIVDRSEEAASVMRFDFLLVEARQLLSIGYDGKQEELHSACYDLLASEARIATFLAVAKGDIPQRAWFRLDRTHVLVKGRVSLLSWTGTMFEYLMPALWMKQYHDTLVSRAMESAVSIQRTHTKRIPWGISESGMAKRDPLGRYGYQAWGIPELALKYGAEDGPVISPYSTFLTLPFARQIALKNLRKMADLGWVGDYGFYEACDYTAGEKSPELVRSWMAHHQGMCLLAATNLLRNNIFQTWFHANPRVRAAELLLHERPLGRAAIKHLQEVSARPASADTKN
ncbi:glucoamylase family protein [Terriglobus roseus]|uniref:glucoamylase family protein n=1 Tax=Terriglobus roseus TaxID=392734 RepID=UPI001FCDD73A|nr:glucoamylase family protein [Terriglobus roseus]